jgi:hypothetical protein
VPGMLQTAFDARAVSVSPYAYLLLDVQYTIVRGAGASGPVEKAIVVDPLKDVQSSADRGI